MRGAARKGRHLATILNGTRADAVVRRESTTMHTIEGMAEV